MAINAAIRREIWQNLGFSPLIFALGTFRKCAPFWGWNHVLWKRDDLRNIFHGCQWVTKVPNGEEKLPKISTGWVGCTNVTDDRQT